MIPLNMLSESENNRNLAGYLPNGCYRLMKIGEALEYRRLTERGGKLLIEEGMEAWATYVRTQRAFLVTWATQEALALCRVLGIQEPELSGEVKRLIEVQPLPL